jgi:hypothetical protein
LKAEPTLTYRIPVEDLVRALDIEEIAEFETEALEGGLRWISIEAAELFLSTRLDRDFRLQTCLLQGPE